MSAEYQRNHYVPDWYQRRFIPSDAKSNELFCLDLKPGTFTDPRGVVHRKKAVYRLGPKYCFVEKDLYTISFGSMESTEIERLFFGPIDSNGRDAVEHFTDFDFQRSGNDKAFNSLMMYMSTQKLRTPKGLKWLKNQVGSNDRHVILQSMIKLRQLFCAIWTECVWSIAKATNSNTKFIVSDHPVTVYNRRCGPRSVWCRDQNDPDIWLNGTHTIFPLSQDQVLILTNLAWVRNPYQSPTKYRPNPNPFRNAIFNFLNIQTERQLSEQEVREINFIIKSRAFRYVAAPKEEWLYPEEYISKSDWAQYGHGYLFMPDPRSVSFTGETLIGFKDGSAIGFDAYGRRPGQPGYNEAHKEGSDEWYTSHKFQGEFARLFGPYRRGRSLEFGRSGTDRDSDEYHHYHLSLEKRKRR